MTTTSKFDKKTALQIIKMLLTSQCSKDDLMCALNIKKTTFYDSLNFLKDTGFDIKNKKNIYLLKHFHESLGFSSYDISILSYLSVLSYTYLPDYKTDIFGDFCEKILYLGEEKNFENFDVRYNFLKTTNISNFFMEKIVAINKFISNNKKSIVTLNTKKEILLLPKEICCDGNRTLLKFINCKNGEEQRISVEKIVKIAPSDEVKFAPEKKETIFELYGKLAKSYYLKDGERIIDNFNDRIVIANGKEGKKELFKRLLRYDVLCKVIYPKSDVREFRKIIEKALENIKEIQDN